MQHVTSKDGTIIAYDRVGQGPALILVHGAMFTSVFYTGLAAILAPHFTVITYDRRGRGGSGDTAPYAVLREVEDLEALINAVGESAFVFGHSTGAVLSLEGARLLPAAITKLAVYEPPFTIDDSLPPAPQDFLPHLKELVSAGRRGEAIEYYMQVVGGATTELIAQMRQSPMWPGIEAIAHAVVYDGAIMEDTLRGDPLELRKWASVMVPTLVMDGTVLAGSAIRHGFLRHGAEELASILPHAQRCTLEGQDHVPIDDVLAPALKKFFLS